MAMREWRSIVPEHKFSTKHLSIANHGLSFRHLAHVCTT